MSDERDSAPPSTTVLPPVVNGLTMPNRIVMAPMSRYFSPNGLSGPDDFDLIAVGRALLLDPTWVQKIRAGKFHELLPFSNDARATHY